MIAVSVVLNQESIGRLPYAIGINGHSLRHPSVTNHRFVIRALRPLDGTPMPPTGTEYFSERVRESQEIRQFVRRNMISRHTEQVRNYYA